VVSGPPKQAGGPVTRARAKFQGGQPWTAITTTRITNWNKAIANCDTDALVQLNLLTKAL
jgi:hypothetical protein